MSESKYTSSLGAIIHLFKEAGALPADDPKSKGDITDVIANVLAIALAEVALVGRIRHLAPGNEKLLYGIGEMLIPVFIMAGKRAKKAPGWRHAMRVASEQAQFEQAVDICAHGIAMAALASPAVTRLEMESRGEM